MNKKWLLVILLAMLALVLTGCGGEKATSAAFFEYIVTPDDTITIYAYTGNEMKVVIPSRIDGKKVTCIGFSDGSYGIMSSVLIPDGVTEIGEKAFKDCKTLTDIVIPNSVTYIGDQAFNGCENLVSITLPESVTHFNPTFANAKFESITLPKGTTGIGAFAFYKCTQLKEIVIPNGVKEIGQSAFSGCTNLTEVTISDGVTTILKGAFQNCSKLTRVELPDSVHTIGESAFRDCSSLEYINIPFRAEVLVIGEKIDDYRIDVHSIFRGCSKVEVHVKKDSAAVEKLSHMNLVIE